MSAANLLRKAAFFLVSVVSFLACFFLSKDLLLFAGVDYVTATVIAAMWGLASLTYVRAATVSDSMAGGNRYVALADGPT